MRRPLLGDNNSHFDLNYIISPWYQLSKDGLDRMICLDCMFVIVIVPL